MPTDKRLLLLSAAAAMSAIAPRAQADLKESQVLVVYDSRITDSRAVAEYYAGSLKVPGGTGGRPGVHTGVRVVDLATLANGGIIPPIATLTHTQYITNYRNPLRAYLSANNLAKSVRCIVLTKGLPHRIMDTDVTNAGDQPALAVNEINAGDATYSSVDSEMTLLYQNLENGENGGTADSKLDGLVLNPYWRSTQSITGYSTGFITSGKLLSAAGGFSGIIWRNLTAGPNAVNPGDIYLTCRLDAPTTQAVFDAIERAQNLAIDLDTATILLDESNSNGTQNTSDVDQEFDNDGPVAFTNGGDDFEQARDFLSSDGRFNPVNIRYNAAPAATQFFVGPLINYGSGIVVNTPVLLLGTYGANHNGTPGNSGTTYPASFVYAPGAIMNSIESYNGRDFGGIGVGFTPQAQISNFIASGGTFAIGNVWEPFSFTVPDNLPLVRGFLLGNLTWVEAAWSSIPGLGWQQIVVGDPLARVRRLQEDLNGDGQTTIEDAFRWNESPNPADLNRSGSATIADLQLLVNSLRTGEGGNMWPAGR
ncbi:MAG: hypothetical protein IT438_07635 [Phycisphaerales bacterium]|nr:hypothetical protein [Phycisphaerales bacterium]